MESDVRCAALEEGSIEMILEVSWGMSGHYVGGISGGDGRRGEEERVHFSG